MSIVEQMYRDPEGVAERIRNDPSLVNAVDSEGKTILHRAFALPSFVTLLLELGANPDVQDSAGNTPVSYAAKWAQCESLVALLRAGGSGAHRDSHGLVPHDWAFKRGRKDVRDALIAAGIRVPLRLRMRWFFRR